MESLPLDIWQHHILPRLRDRRALRFVSRFCHALLRPALPDAWSCFSPIFATAMMREGWHLRPKVLRLFAERYEREEAAYSWTVGSLCGRRDRVLIERVDIDNWVICCTSSTIRRVWSAWHRPTMSRKRDPFGGSGCHTIYSAGTLAGLAGTVRATGRDVYYREPPWMTRHIRSHVPPAPIWIHRRHVNTDVLPSLSTHGRV